MLCRDAPGIIVVENLLEIEDILEVLAPVLVPLDQHADVHEGKDELAHIVGRVDAPVLEDGAREGAETSDREAASSLGELLPGYVAPLLLPRDDIMQRIQEKHVGAAVVARMPLLKPGQHVDGFAGVHAAKLHLRAEVANQGA